MKLNKIDDALTGSEYADVESFTGLKVRVLVDAPILIPQVYDGPYRRIVGRGLPFNPLGVVALPLAALPEGLQGLVQVDDLMGEVTKLINAERLAMAKNPLNADTPMETLLELATKNIGEFCVAGPATMEGIEVDGRRSKIRDLVMDIRYRNKPEDYIFLGREIEIELSGTRSSNIRSAVQLHARPIRSQEDRISIQMCGGGGNGGIDVRRQKFELTATKITLV